MGDIDGGIAGALERCVDVHPGVGPGRSERVGATLVRRPRRHGLPTARRPVRATQHRGRRRCGTDGRVHRRRGRFTCLLDVAGGAAQWVHRCHLGAAGPPARPSAPQRRRPAGGQPAGWPRSRARGGATDGPGRDRTAARSGVRLQRAVHAAGHLGSRPALVQRDLIARRPPLVSPAETPGGGAPLAPTPAVQRLRYEDVDAPSGSPLTLEQPAGADDQPSTGGDAGVLATPMPTAPAPTAWSPLTPPPPPAGVQAGPR